MPPNVSFTCDKAVSQLLFNTLIVVPGAAFVAPVKAPEPTNPVFVVLLATPAAKDIKMLSTLSWVNLQFCQALETLTTLGELNLLKVVKEVADQALCTLTAAGKLLLLNVVKLVHPLQALVKSVAAGKLLLSKTINPDCCQALVKTVAERLLLVKAVNAEALLQVSAALVIPVREFPETLVILFVNLELKALKKLSITFAGVLLILAFNDVIMSSSCI